MSKVKVLYDLENIDDELALNRALKSTNMAIVLFEIQYNLKKKCEYELESLEADSDKWDGLEVVFQNIQRLFDQHDINLNDLIR